MFSQFKLISTALLLTLLIWITADQSLITSAELRVSIELIPPANGGMIITTRPPVLRAFQIRVTGSREVLDPLRNEVLKVQLPISERRAGVYELDLLDELRANAYRFMNLAVEEVDPDTLEIVVDRTIRQEVPIRVIPGSVEYDVAPTVDPDRVEIMIAESAWNRLQEQASELFIELEAERSVSGWPQGELLRKQVPLVEPKVAGVPVHASPDTVTLSCNIRQQRKSAVLKAVPIRFEAQIDIFNAYSVERRSDDTLLTLSITVKGPPEVVDKLVNGELKVSSVIQFTTNDTVDAAEFKYYTPKFYLPAGVELTEKPADIELRLARRDEAVSK